MARIWWLMGGSAVFRESVTFGRVVLDRKNIYDGTRNIRRGATVHYIGRYRSLDETLCTLNAIVPAGDP